MKLFPAIINLVFIFLLSAQGVFAQTDSITLEIDSIADASINNDSLNAALLDEYSQKIAQIEQQRVLDSLTKADLKTQLNSLKTTDNLKKEELQKQIQDLNEKESKQLALKKAQIDSLRTTAVGVPVMGFFNDTLFHIYNRLGSQSAKDRAIEISKKVDKLASNFLYRADSLKLVEVDGITDIVFEKSIIMSVSQDDGLWNNLTKEELAQRNLDIITAAITKYRSDISLVEMAKDIALALLVILITGIIIFYINKFFAWIVIKIHEQEGKRIKGIKIKNYTLFDAKRQVNVLSNISTILKWLIILILIYVALPILFGIFPWTQNFAETLFGYILSPVKKIIKSFLKYLPDLITVIVILVVFRYAFKGLYFIKTEIRRGKLHIAGFYPDWANPTHQILRVLLFAFMIVVIFPYLPGSDSPVFKGVSVFLGFLFTFGSAGSLSHIIAGIMLTYMRLFKIGDRVKVGDVVGDVMEKSLLVTRVRTIKNEIISIPNSTVMNSHTINYSSDAPDKGLIIHSTITLGYDVPWREVHKVLIEAATKTELVLEEPIPFVLQTSLDDFYVSYQINAYIRESNKQLC